MGEHLKCTNDETFPWSKKLYNRLRSYGWNAFNKIIIKYDLSEKEAKDTEIEMIGKYNTFEKGLNSTPGGDSPGIGSNHPRAQAVNVYNNMTGEIMSFSWEGSAAEFLGIPRGYISCVANSSNVSEQTYSPAHNGWFQIKKAYDNTPFIENMPTLNEKRSILVSGENHPGAQAVNIYNNTTKEITSFTWIGSAADFIGVESTCIDNVLSSLNSTKQTYSPIFDTYFQVKYAYDTTPFIRNMPSPAERISIMNKGRKHTEESRKNMSESSTGVKNHRAKSLFIFGTTYPTMTAACCALRTYNKAINTWLEDDTITDVYHIPRGVYSVLI
jgi:hypothetical protein